MGVCNFPCTFTGDWRKYYEFIENILTGFLNKFLSESEVAEFIYILMVVGVAKLWKAIGCTCVFIYNYCN